MKATELRLGNLFINSQGGIQEVTTAHLEYLLNDSFEPNNEGMNPIPLTEEWLLKFGFDKTKDRRKYVGYIGEYFFYKENETWRIELGGRDETILIEIKYVHQLQNLYFAMTGDEPTIKL